MDFADAKTRFSNRVDHYVRYRPSYPKEIVALLTEHCGLTASSIIADVGSGTGILSRLFLENGNTVFSVEPNEPMRLAAEKELSDFANFKSIDATAESTSLPDASVDLVTAGQAFHWFNPAESRKEFQRILRRNPESPSHTGWVSLIWNIRNFAEVPFMQKCEELFYRYGTDYQKVFAQRIDVKEIEKFFDNQPLQIFSLPNAQTFDLIGLKGRIQSCSYAPEVGTDAHQAMTAELEKIFAEYQQNGVVQYQYKTMIYCGRWLK